MPEEQDVKPQNTPSNQSFDAVTISDYFEYVSALVDEGVSYKDPETRFIVPVRQLTTTPRGELTTAEDMLVEVTLSKDFLYGQSYDNINELLESVKRQLDNNILPEGQILHKLEPNDVRRSHEPDPAGRPFRYVGKAAGQESRRLICFPITQNIQWPTSTQPVNIQAGGAITAGPNEFRRLKTRVDAVQSFFKKNNVPDKDFIIRRHFFHMTSGQFLSTKDNVKPVQPQEFATYEPMG